ncbi:MAG: rRNA maturation RNase YbeY [bacterium]|nr:rRNA maturation RNase YbeY [bacterium]
MSVDIKVTVRPLPLFSKSGKGRIPFEKIAHSVLGKKYELSLVICGDFLARKMNKTYRKKIYAPNVLSFPLFKQEGEIFLNVRAAAREAKQFNIPLRERLAHLLVHGCFHLKGLRHGRIMESKERRTLRAFNFPCKGSTPA